jgi:general stress protein YciG
MASKRGFAAMDPLKQKQIASLGGTAAHKKGTAHKWTREEAMIAGKKGGKARHKN